MPAARHPTDAEERARYLRHQNSLGCAGYVERAEAVALALCAARPGARTALDFGCGPRADGEARPVLAALLARRGLSVAACDRFFAPWPALGAAAFDLVAAVEVVEHFRRPLHEAEALFRLVAPGGVLAVGTAFLETAGQPLDGWWYLEDPTHLTIWSRAALLRLARAHGLEPPDQPADGPLLLARGA